MRMYPTARLTTFTSLSPVYPQPIYKVNEALSVDCQSIKPFWADVPGLASGQANSMPHADTMLQFHLPTKIHTHRTTKFVLLAIACGL
jgi:hypothetical protein